MKSFRLCQALSASAIALIAAACAAPPPPAPPPAARPAPPPAPAPAPAPLAGDWIDWPLTPGDWSYSRNAGGSLASFGSDAAPRFAVRCDLAARRIELAHLGKLEAGRSAAMTVRATAGTARYPLANSAAQPGYVVASLPPADPQLDRMIFSRGRFLVEVEGAAQPLVIPAWPEVARVVEDCR
ncbi:MAG: hypothetical protein GW859_00500 [Sphingomonadales bacterium]|nr:hypothetical protein [Sphingomonadales bacterium]